MTEYGVCIGMWRYEVAKMALGHSKTMYAYVSLFIYLFIILTSFCLLIVGVEGYCCT